MEKGGEDRESGLEEVGYRRNIIKIYWLKKKKNDRELILIEKLIKK